MNRNFNIQPCPVFIPTKLFFKFSLYLKLLSYTQFNLWINFCFKSVIGWP